MTPKTFRNTVWQHWRKKGRHTLPWRATTDPYHLLVSEVMLQQTQVERVIPYYHTFLAAFPTVQVLATAPLSEVLIMWKGLGYNRRAQRLHEAAGEVVHIHHGVFPTSAQELERLPGIGPYTASAVAAFAYNQDGILLETNIRTAVTHHYFPDEDTVSDSQVKEVLGQVYPKGRAREWYGALMDYGAHLKLSGVRINTKAKGYKKQAPFKGSSREVRGALVRAVSRGACTRGQLRSLFGKERREQIDEQLIRLQEERLIKRAGARYSLVS